MSNTFLWIVWPYIAFTIFVSLGLYRYFNDRFSFSSQSSQFLENRLSFWGSTMWHYGIILILIPHTLAHTTLGFKGPGDAVNLETDLLAKYVWKFMIQHKDTKEDMTGQEEAG